MVDTYGLGEVHVTFSRGQWVGDRWGSAPIASPQGVELWAWFMPNADGDTPKSRSELRGAWRGLTNALGGLLGSSINFLDSDTQHVHPRHSVRPTSGVLTAIWGAANAPDSHVYLGSLPREVACTENLTPWAKLLPCRQHAGLASLLRVCLPSARMAHGVCHLAHGMSLPALPLIKLVRASSWPTAIGCDAPWY